MWVLFSPSPCSVSCALRRVIMLGCSSRSPWTPPHTVWAPHPWVPHLPGRELRKASALDCGCGRGQAGSPGSFGPCWVWVNLPFSQWWKCEHVRKKRSHHQPHYLSKRTMLLCAVEGCWIGGPGGLDLGFGLAWASTITWRRHTDRHLTFLSTPVLTSASWGVFVCQGTI